MIADVNDAAVTEAAADDEDLAGIRSEIHNMAQNKEVQNMLTQEMFERMDWVSYGEECEEEGRKKERANTEKMQKRAVDAEVRVKALEAENRKLKQLLGSLAQN